jgi:hypothetical protein
MIGKLLDEVCGQCHHLTLNATVSYNHSATAAVPVFNLSKKIILPLRTEPIKVIFL